MGFLKRAASAVKTNKQESQNFSSNVFERLSKQRAAFKAQFFRENENATLAIQNPVRFIFKYVNKDVIDNAINTNPQIRRILNENKLSLDYEIENVTSIIASHLIPTAKCAERIYNKLNKKFDADNFSTLIQAALLHDIGKVFIPREILNKTSKLSLRERELVELHNSLSYEILKTTDLAQEVATLTREHHDYRKNLKRNPQNQTLTIADVYCALREQRPYKKAIDDIRAKAILYDMGAKGCFDISYIKYLW